MGTVNLVFSCKPLLTPQPNSIQLASTSTMKVLVSLLLIAVVASISYAGVPKERTTSLHLQCASTLVISSVDGWCNTTTTCVGGTYCDDDRCCENWASATCCGDHKCCPHGKKCCDNNLLLLTGLLKFYLKFAAELINANREI